MWASIGGAVMNIILNFIFIKQFGYIAAGYTTLFCYILFAFGHYLFMKKLLSQKLPDTHIYNIRYIFFFSLVLLIAMFLIVAVYPYILIRYTIILVIFIGLFLNRKKIMDSIVIIKK